MRRLIEILHISALNSFLPVFLMTWSIGFQKCRSNMLPMQHGRKCNIFKSQQHIKDTINHLFLNFILFPSLFVSHFLVLLTSDLSAGTTTLFLPQCLSLIVATKDQLKSLEASLKWAMATKYISKQSFSIYTIYISLTPYFACTQACWGLWVFPGSHQWTIPLTVLRADI